MHQAKILATRTWRHFMHDSLYRNSIFLMISTAMLAAFGFAFWTIAAHLYTTSQVGIATTLISATGLLSNLSLFGFNHSFVRFLPSEKDKKVLIDSGLTIVTVVAALLAVGFVSLIPRIAPDLDFIRRTPSLILALILYIVLAGQNNITDSIFLSYKATIYTFLADVAQCLVKISLPFLLVGYTDGGLFLAYATGTLADMVFSFSFLATKFNYTPRPTLNTEKIKKVLSFSVGNYFGDFLQSSPALIAPVIITAEVNPSTSAYYYLAMTIASLVFVIPRAITQSLFAEGSHTRHIVRRHIIRSIKLMGGLLIPLCTLLCLFGGIVLKIFGHQYSENGLVLLRLFTVSALFIAINYLGMTVLKIYLHTKAIVIINLLGALFIVFTTVLYASHSLRDTAYTWLIGQALMSIMFITYSAVRLRLLRISGC